MNIKAKILYVEDDLTLSLGTRDNLELHGYEIDFCEDGIEALRKFNDGYFNLCMLDVMLPKMDGCEQAAKIKAKNENVPIIFPTAKSTKEDNIHGLKLGADDYITKPFGIEELVLNMEVFLKRSSQPAHHAGVERNCEFVHCVFDISNHHLKSPDGIKQLTHREAELMKMLCSCHDTILKRDDILMQGWGDDHYFACRSLDVFISRLRKLIKSDASVKIENIHNVGYG